MIYKKMSMPSGSHFNIFGTFRYLVRNFSIFFWKFQKNTDCFSLKKLFLMIDFLTGRFILGPSDLVTFNFNDFIL
jgi:hypothetical protein